MATPKTNKELDIRLEDLQKYFNYDPREVKGRKGKSLASFISEENTDTLKEMLKYVKQTIKEEEKRLQIYKSLGKYLDRYAILSKDKKELLKEEISLLEKSSKEMDNQVKSQGVLNDLRRLGRDILKDTVKNNAELFRISHDMQLESNVTWKNYRKMYEGAYESTRKANKEIEQSIHNVKDLVETQNRLLGSGWKDIDPAVLTNVSTAVMNLQKTMGMNVRLSEGLITSFEQSYRIFGEQTDTFITNIGNRLNAFSNTFGVRIDMLQNAVSDMIESNNFIHRSNMQAQTAANESLIKAAALSGAVGLTSSNFITRLAETAQFGTMEEMATIYQGGALLQGFDTQRFQQQMISTDYEGATKQLLESIYGTLNSIDDHYLRAEYMTQIGSSFGLSRDELKLIATSGGNLDQYSKDIQNKLVGVNTSMKDELKDLNVNLVDRIDNAIQNSWASEKMGSFLQEYGLFGMTEYLGPILHWVQAIAAKLILTGSDGKSLIGKIKMPALTKQVGQVPNGMLASGTIPGSSMTGLSTAGTPYATTTALTGAGKLAVGAGGLAVGIGGNVVGRNIQTNTNISDPLANVGGGALNVASGAAGGAMLGSVIPGIGTVAGAIIGGIAGGINTWVGVNKRKDALQEIDDQERAARRAKSNASFVYSGDPMVDAINRQTDALISAITGNHEENKTLILMGETYKNTTVLSEL